MDGVAPVPLWPTPAVALRTEKRENAKIYASVGESAHLAATLQTGVIVNIRSCDGAWRLVDGDGFNGYIRSVKQWGRLSQRED